MKTNRVKIKVKGCLIASAFTWSSALPLAAQFNNLVNGFESDWSAAQWGNGEGVSPTSAESSFWNGDNTITIQSGTDAVANVLYLGNTNLTNSSLTLAEEGSLTLSGATRIADAADANFYLNLYGDFIGTTMFVGGVNFTDTEGEAQVTIGGGSFKLSSFI